MNVLDEVAYCLEAAKIAISLIEMMIFQKKCHQQHLSDINLFLDYLFSYIIVQI